MEYQVGLPSGEQHLSGNTILVVDDDPLVREAAAQVLGYCGYKVLEARDGVEAVALFAAHRDEISAVLMDVMMPRMGGLEATRLIRDLAPEAKVILSSGFPGTDLESVKPAAILPKPYRGLTLCKTVQAVLEGDPAALAELSYHTP